MMRVAVPTGPEVSGIGAGAWVTALDSFSSFTSSARWFSIRLTVATVPPLVRSLLPTRTSGGLGQCRAVTTQSLLTREPVQPPTKTGGDHPRRRAGNTVSPTRRIAIRGWAPCPGAREGSAILSFRGAGRLP